MFIKLLSVGVYSCRGQRNMRAEAEREKVCFDFTLLDRSLMWSRRPSVRLRSLTYAGS